MREDQTTHILHSDSTIATMADANQAALYDARRRNAPSSSQLLDSIIQGSNCKAITVILQASSGADKNISLVDRDEVDRLRKYVLSQSCLAHTVESQDVFRDSIIRKRLLNPIPPKLLHPPNGNTDARLRIGGS